ncbi:glycine zipper 2TM domain-containing protein [Paraburkholderia azotifigens]|uniref:Glycine zipper 2TM domain-containing protein n=1 Tax=Paraburkholderia azotifigens TaxID=2057004 RepID=A0A5C6VU49_9BURK|nr:glycine zipper 2TM domain-containing protein [Paraburkholderia azotifigens]TXC86898.1 glycine zipper 2TM domain-containing protein [Paraburkholderia azotifigens]
MTHTRFARPLVRTTLLALCITLPLAGCVVPGNSPYGSTYGSQYGSSYGSGYATQPAQPVYAQPGYTQPPQYQQPYAQQPQYQQPGYDDQSGWQNNQAYQQQPQPQQGYGYGEQYGVVSSIQPLANPGSVTAGGVAGTVIGAVVGGVIGNQFGRGHGRDAATAIGVLGGAVAGNQLGQQAGASSPGGYRIAVQLNDGSTRAFDVGSPGDLHPGDRVRIAGNRLDRY